MREEGRARGVRVDVKAPRTKNNKLESSDEGQKD